LGGAVNSAICALGFVPVCAVVLGAAERAVRARLGSIVAGDDRRAVWGILANALAAATLIALPDGAASRRHGVRAPRATVAMGACAALVIAGVIAAEVIALARVRRVARADLVQRDPEEARDADRVESVDLGLGDDVQARMERATNAYRSQDRAVGMVI